MVPNGRAFATWASHGSELPLLFHNLDFTGPVDGRPVHVELTREERELATDLAQLWISFATSSEPVRPVAKSSGTNWPRLEPHAGRLSLRLATPATSSVRALKAADCEFWSALNSATN